MIDPRNITDFNRDNNQLEEVLIFWIFAAGKKASTVSERLESILVHLQCLYGEDLSPFELINLYPADKLGWLFKKNGIGCFNNKSKSVLDLISKGLNLKTCSIEDLEKVYGIGPKTARCFIIHSRENANCAGLDTHQLKFLRFMGYDAPKSTPTGKNYKRVEDIFLNLAKERNLSIAEYDLSIWKSYSSKNKKEINKIKKAS